MDEIGSLELAWAQGYDGHPACFIESEVVCFRCGNNIKFLTVDGEENVFPSPGDGLGPMAVHSINKVFAFADRSLPPKLYIFQYPSFQAVGNLEGGAQLEYTFMSFSSSEYLATITGIPDHQLIIWKYTDGTKLCSYDLGPKLPTAMTFNPANWRQLCTSTKTELFMWNIEQSNDSYVIQKKKLRLPVVDGSYEADEADRLPTRASTRMTRVSLDLPMSSIAGLMGDEANQFEEYTDERERAQPMAQVWTPSGDVFIGCSGGQLLRVDGESLLIKILYKPVQRAASAISQDGRELSDLDVQSSLSTEAGRQLSSGSMSCLALHKEGLFAGGEDGVLRMLHVTKDSVNVKAAWPLGSPINSLQFNLAHFRLVIGSSKGSLHLYDTRDGGSLSQLADCHYGNFIACQTLAPGNEYSVSVREDGEFQVWKLDNAKLAGSLPLGIQACSMAASPLFHVAAVGSFTGHLYFIDVNQLDKPRVIQCIKLHDGPIYHLTFNSNGLFLLTGSTDGQVFVVDGRASKAFHPLGHVETPGVVQAISCHYDNDSQLTRVVVTSNATGTAGLGANKLVHFKLPIDVANDSKSYLASLKCDFKPDAISKLSFNIAAPSCGVSVSGEGHVFTLGQTSKQLHKIALPSQAPKKENSKDSFLQPVEQYVGHQLQGGSLVLSPHQKWLASCGSDGYLTLRAVGTLDRTLSVHAHDYRIGGVRSTAFSADATRMLTCGYDGTLLCHKWNFSEIGISKAQSALEAARSRQTSLLHGMQEEDSAAAAIPDYEPAPPSRPDSGVEKADKEKLEKEQLIEKAIENDDIFKSPTPLPHANATWLEVQKLEALKEEDKQYADVKGDLRSQIRDMRRKLQGMMTENESMADIERLARHEFDLDIEEQNRLQAAGEAEVNRIREEKEFDNLAKRYLADLIKKECWDDMVVKGRGIEAFSSVMQVQNYPLKARSAEEMAELDIVQAQRQIEIADLQARREIVEVLKHNTPGGTPAGSRVASAMVASPIMPIITKAKAEDDLNENDDQDGEGKEKPSTTGSLGAQFGGGSELFYSQFELHTRQQKMNQIVMLKDAIHRIKKNFNTEFDGVYEKKEQEINKIKEKNKRILKILEDLEQPLEVYEPKLSVVEKPEMLLTVTDDEESDEEEAVEVEETKEEDVWTPPRRVSAGTHGHNVNSQPTKVKVEKYLTPEQRKRLEEEQRQEEERRARERGDNWRQRGLDSMMGGVLEIKKEDELKRDIPMPSFMTAKPEDDWSEEEKKTASDYERRVNELMEERDKFRKQLEQELKKLQGQIQEGTIGFDETLQALFTRKIRTEMVIGQEELKILRLKYSLLREEEINNREEELKDLLEFKKELKQLSASALTESRKAVDAFREHYDNLIATDKVMDKAFKREFHDVPALQVDLLYKLFRRRPKGQKARGAETPIFDVKSGYPFFERPSTAYQNDQANHALEIALTDLDKPSNAPEGVEPDVWDHLCQYRNSKIQSEQLVKQKALVLADMEAFMKRRQEEDDDLKQEIEDLLQSMNRLKEERLRFTCNLEVQLLLKQGQVEVDAGAFIPDYKDSLLIHRSVVEDLNGKIRGLGESKIASMVESKDFRKSIVQLEWEHKKMTMEMEDLQNKMRDIQNLKVTREIQSYLNQEDHEARKAQEIATMEQTLIMQKQQHEKNVNDKKRILKDLKRVIRERSEENAQLTSELEGLNVSVNERRHIHEVNADKRSDAGREKRYRDIVQRRKLVDLAKAQAQEVAVLRAEVERLRMRTFPALVQVEH